MAKILIIIERDLPEAILKDYLYAIKNSMMSWVEPEIVLKAKFQEQEFKEITITGEQITIKATISIMEQI
ncbi:MAG: hypothetical protein KKD77_21875 [Gammaproteobacteria bacterium]|nr:hypothetical protein [Gammaproteobacteria bacterium]